MEWKIEPTPIHIWLDDEEKSHSILAIDESGTSTFKMGQNLHYTPWFVIAGVQLTYTNVKSLSETVSDLKRKYWQDGQYNNKQVVFHSRDIRKRQKAFSLLGEEYINFRADLDDTLRSMDALIFSAAINKVGLQKQYIFPDNPYKLSLTFLLERYVTQLSNADATGIVLLESRGYHDDRRLLKMVVSIITNGTDYIDSSEFSRIIGVYFGTKHLPKGSSNWPLELADITAYRIRRKIEGAPNSTEAFNDIKTKIYGAPSIDGKGLKIFPKDGKMNVN